MFFRIMFSVRSSVELVPGRRESRSSAQSCRRLPRPNSRCGAPAMGMRCNPAFRLCALSETARFDFRRAILRNPSSRSLCHHFPGGHDLKQVGLLGGCFFFTPSRIVTHIVALAPQEPAVTARYGGSVYLRPAHWVPLPCRFRFRES